ncbi:MAG: hypothetical protein JNM67_05280, partial [Bacteroidetes bacterium]|nr:hypothetical protein [Bacteroidota bacterium]
MSTQVSEKELLLRLKPLLETSNAEGALEVLEEYRPEDIAEIFWDIELDEAKFLIKILDKLKAVEIIRSLDPELQERLFKGYESREIAEDVVSYLDSDD